MCRGASRSLKETGARDIIDNAKAPEAVGQQHERPLSGCCNVAGLVSSHSSMYSVLKDDLIAYPLRRYAKPLDRELEMQSPSNAKAQVSQDSHQNSVFLL